MFVLLVAQTSMFVILSCFASDSSEQTRVDVTSACARLRSQPNALLGTRVFHCAFRRISSSNSRFQACGLLQCIASTFKLVLENLYFFPPHTGRVIMDVLIIENQMLEKETMTLSWL